MEIRPKFWLESDFSQIWVNGRALALPELNSIKALVVIVSFMFYLHVLLCY